VSRPTPGFPHDNGFHHDLYSVQRRASGLAISACGNLTDLTQKRLGMHDRRSYTRTELRIEAQPQGDVVVPRGLSFQ
jgi:hypothetical protein